MLLFFGAPGQLQSLAGQEHGRTIPLTDIERAQGLAVEAGFSPIKMPL
jgi:hypothetical protein